MRCAAHPSLGLVNLILQSRCKGLVGRSTWPGQSHVFCETYCPRRHTVSDNDHDPVGRERLPHNIVFALLAGWTLAISGHCTPLRHVTLVP
jgi:hypothetical protein